MTSKREYGNVSKLVSSLIGAIDVDADNVDVITNILDGFQYNPEEWKRFCHFNCARYQRNLIFVNEKMSIICDCWEPQQSTPIHTHECKTGGESRCWLKVLEGELCFCMYGGKDGHYTLKQKHLLTSKGHTMFAGEIGHHKVTNPDKERPAISIHVYSPPYLECMYDDEGGTRCSIPVIRHAHNLLGHLSGERSLQQKLAVERCVHSNFKSFIDLLRREFVDEATRPSVQRVKDVLGGVRFNREECLPYQHWDSKKYTRNLVGYGEHFTVLMLCWSPQQQSPIHAHAGSNCWVKVIDGDIEEQLFDVSDESAPPMLKKTSRVGTEGVCYIDDSMGVHLMRNPSPDRGLVSLHIYSPPYTECFVYNPNTPEKQLMSIECANVGSGPVANISQPPEQTTSLPELIERLKASFADPFEPHIKALLNGIKFQPKEWKQYVHYSPHRYTRNLIAFDENFSLILNCWNKGQKTPVHDHGPGRCTWMKVLEGALTFNVFEKTGSEEQLEITRTYTFLPSSNVFEEPQGVLHEVCNESDTETAVSVHMYSPPYIECLFKCPHTKENKAIPVAYCGKTDPDMMSRLCVRLTFDQHVFTNFDELVQMIGNHIASNKEISSILNHITLDQREVEQYCKFSKSHYTRNMIAKSDEFVLVLTCWNSTNQSPIHDHNGSKCWVKMLSGKLTETHYTLTPNAESWCKSESKTLHAGSVYELEETVIHSMKNNVSERAVCLILLVPGYEECCQYEPDTGERKAICIKELLHAS